MAGRVTLRFQKSNALAFPKKTTACNSKDQAKRTILRSVRSQGHIYVELREDGKKSFFFCTLCLAPCYSDSVLFDHLNGSLHNERFLTAKVTLLGPNPWPFNDGVVFFSNPIEDEEETVASNGKQRRLPESHENGHSLAIIAYDGQVNEVDDQNEDQNEDLESVEESDAVVIPGVRVGSEVTNLKAKELGYGLLSARFRDNDISRIWCEWLGERTVEDDEEFSMVPEHDFAVVTFSYNDFNLGRVGFLDDVKSLLCSSPTTETQNGEGSNSKRTKLLSDPKDAIEGSDSHYDSAGDDSSVSTTSSLMLHQYDSQLLDSRFISSKAMRREMRRKQRIAAERMCDICQHKMLPGKDVATLMNVKNGKLACSSRNGNGAFHLFHTSCVIHWVLLCEAETISKQPEVPKAKRRSRRKTASKSNEVRNEVAINPLWTPIGGVICPECQGTGTVVDGDDEKPSVPLSKMFKYKIKVSDARREWMKSPESLKNCSTGFCFPTQSGENIQEKVKPLKLLRFYGVREV